MSRIDNRKGRGRWEGEEVGILASRYDMSFKNSDPPFGNERGRNNRPIDLSAMYKETKRCTVAGLRERRMCNSKYRTTNCVGLLLIELLLYM